MSPDLALHMERVLPAPRERVFAAFTDPRELPKWWGPHGFTMPEVELDLRAGGDYRFTMQPPEGDRFHLEGEFLEVDPPARLAYTFRWDPPDPDDRETTVRLSFADLGDSTEVVLDQAGFATEARLNLHDQGWADSFERLRDALGGRGGSGSPVE
jgi:uncharacterized protein YndB with AHSA1/START domain